MVQEKLRFYPRLNRVVDVLLLILCFFGAYYLNWHRFPPNAKVFFTETTLTLVLCWGEAAVISGLYNQALYEQPSRLMQRHFFTILISAILVGFAVCFVKYFMILRIFFIYGYFLFMLVDTLFRGCIVLMLRRQ